MTATTRQEMRKLTASPVAAYAAACHSAEDWRIPLSHYGCVRECVCLQASLSWPKISSNRISTRLSWNVSINVNTLSTHFNPVPIPFHSHAYSPARSATYSTIATVATQSWSISVCE